MPGKLIGALVGAIAVYVCTPTLSRAQAHFAPGVANIRDYAVPQPGLYVAVYNYGYVTSTLTDNNGIKVNQVAIGNVPAVPVSCGHMRTLGSLGGTWAYVANIGGLQGRKR